MCLDERDIMPKVNGSGSKGKQIATGDSYNHLEGLNTLEDVVDQVTEELSRINRIIHENPELGFEEYIAHDLLVDYAREAGFQVTPHAFGLATAWKATFSHGHGGPVVGVNSEMDALPGLGHACGHNLIAVAGIATAIAVARTLKKHDKPGKVILLGTPAEEGGGGKVIMLKAGAYKEMDVCMMAHPCPESGFPAMLARAQGTYDFHGHPAHAALAPHEAVNALDACVIAYNSISMFRQQILPTSRIHLNIITDAGAPINVIPAHAKLVVACRALDDAEFERITGTVKICVQAAAASARCTFDAEWSDPYLTLQHNMPLAQEFARYMSNRHQEDFPWSDEPVASTDFGNVSKEVPSIHPCFEIPTGHGAKNHTKAFTASAGTTEAFEAAMRSAKGMAATGWRCVVDPGFLGEVRASFEAGKKAHKMEITNGKNGHHANGA